MPMQKTNKTKLTLTVDKNLVESAREININLSAFLELKLREYLSVIKNGIQTIPQWARGGSNSRPSPCEGDVITTRPRALNDL